MYAAIGDGWCETIFTTIVPPSSPETIMRLQDAISACENGSESRLEGVLIWV